jgi:hypothetical protein
MLKIKTVQTIIIQILNLKMVVVFLKIIMTKEILFKYILKIQTNNENNKFYKYNISLIIWSQLQNKF